MIDTSLAELAREHNVEYKHTIESNEVWPWLLRENTLDSFHTTNRAMLLQKGIAPLDTLISFKFAVDPRKNPLFDKGTGNAANDTLAEYLRMCFVSSMDGMEGFIDNEIRPLIDGGEVKKRQFEFVYAPQSEIDKALAYHVKGYAEKCPHRESYDERLNVVLAEVYRKMLAFRKGEGELKMPPEAKANAIKRPRVYSRDLEEVEGMKMVPIHYDDEVWPTIFWLEHLTSWPTTMHGLFKEYDNVLEGDHIEQWVSFDDYMINTAMAMDGAIRLHIMMCLSDEEIRKFHPQEVGNLLRNKPGVKKLHTSGGFQFERVPGLTDDVLKSLAPSLGNVLSCGEDFFRAAKTLKQIGAGHIIEDQLPRYLTCADLDSRMKVSKEEFEEILKSIVKEQQYTS